MIERRPSMKWRARRADTGQHTSRRTFKANRRKQTARRTRHPKNQRR